MERKDLVEALRSECKECSEFDFCRNGVSLAGIYCPKS